MITLGKRKVISKRYLLPKGLDGYQVLPGSSNLSLLKALYPNTPGKTNQMVKF